MDTPDMTVSGWMHAPVHTVAPQDSIEHAREVCERFRINQLPVVQDGTLVGIITDRDLRDAFPSIAEEVEHPARAHRATTSTAVADVMTGTVLTVGSSEDIEHAAAVMRRERIGALPVEHDGRLVGILTRSDLLNALCALATRVRAGAGARAPRNPAG